MIKPEQLIGAWHLDEWRIEYSNGKVTHPYGKDAVGQILYTSDGEMSATVSIAKRDVVEADNIRDAEADRLTGLYKSYFHYAGRWRLDGDDVVHSVLYSLNPNMVNTEQRRHARLLESKKQLHLSAIESLGDAASRKHLLVWKKMDSLKS